MIQTTIKIFEIVAICGCISSSLYYMVCLFSAASFLSQARVDETVHATPPVSILKPLKGADPEMYESFRSHCVQEYPEYEIIFGVSDAADPAVDFVRKLQQEFPDRAIRLVVCLEKLGTNVKVSNLEQIVKVARYQYLLVNDSDIRVEPDYLQRVIAPLSDGRVGMVTCLYRGAAAPTLGSRLEALGIGTDFCGGVLVARMLERGLHFGLGSTLAFRRSDLERIGGFRSIVDFLADDYELGRRIANLGLQVKLSDQIVETHLPAYDLRGFLSHQLRWARGVRDARGAGYAGLVLTFGVMWALIALGLAHAAAWSCAILVVVVALRATVALVVGTVVLRDRQVFRDVWLLPLRDLLAVGVWAASFAGHTVTWRGDRFVLKNGRLIRDDCHFHSRV